MLLVKMSTSLSFIVRSLSLEEYLGFAVWFFSSFVLSIIPVPDWFDSMASTGPPLFILVILLAILCFLLSSLLPLGLENLNVESP